MNYIMQKKKKKKKKKKFYFAKQIEVIPELSPSKIVKKFTNRWQSHAEIKVASFLWDTVYTYISNQRPVAMTTDAVAFRLSMSII